MFCLAVGKPVLKNLCINVVATQIVRIQTNEVGK